MKIKEKAFGRYLSLLTVIAVFSFVFMPAWAHSDEDNSGEQQRWQEMSEHERAEIRAGQQRFQKLSPEEKQNLRKAQQHYRNLSEDEQRALREHWRDTSRKKQQHKNKN